MAITHRGKLPQVRRWLARELLQKLTADFFGLLRDRRNGQLLIERRSHLQAVVHKILAIATT